MHYYKRHIGDYAKKAGHLSPLEHGVYNLIIDSYYDREQAPTLIEATRWARARTDDEKAAVQTVLDEFFTLDNDRYHQKRINEELEAYHGKAETNRAIALQREKQKRARKEDDSLTIRAPEQHEPCTTGQPNHKPLTTNHEPLKEEAPAKRSSDASGSRLPKDWKPSPEDTEYCKTERPDLLPSKVAQNFYDYWIAKAGKDGRKTDWSATWRSWVRKEDSKSAGRPGAAPAQTLKWNPNSQDRSADAAFAAAARKRLGIDGPDNGEEIEI